MLAPPLKSCHAPSLRNAVLNDGGHHIISKTVTGDEKRTYRFLKFQHVKKAKSTGLVKAIKLEGQKTVTANWYITKCLPKILQEVNVKHHAIGVEARRWGSQLRCRPGHLIMVQNRRGPLPKALELLNKATEIDNRVERKQTTAMWICDRWMQEGTTNRRGRSHPPQCTTSREDRQIVRMAVTDRSVTSRTVAQHIESVSHHSVSPRTIRRLLQQSVLSARRPLLCLPLTQSHRRLNHQWYSERRMWVAEGNAVVFTDESRICLQHHNGQILVWRHRGERMLNSCTAALVLHRVLWYGGGIGFHSRTPLVRIVGTLNSQRYISEVLEPVVLSYLQGLAIAMWPR
ncbi:transposable element Tcb1 transposase [Trichonephila clavipes]|nr:transposable element Tcb1 transposase [Trichonephila clavipes]